MKKVLIISSMFLLVAMLLASYLIISVLKIKANSITPDVTLHNSNPAIVPIKNVAPPVAGTGDNPADIIESKVYTTNNEQIFMVENFGLLVTADGRPIVDRNNSSITMFDIERQEFLNGANVRLTAYYNGFLDKKYLSSGKLAVASITSNREIFMIQIKTGKDELGEETRMFIWTFREKVDYGLEILWHPGAWFNTHYRYYDMNGRLIDDKKIVTEWNDAHFVKTFTANLLFYLGTAGIGPLINLISGESDRVAVPYVKVHDICKLSDIQDIVREFEVRYYGTFQQVLTEDGYNIFVRPSSHHCVDIFNYPLFSAITGKPIVYFENEIVDLSLTVCLIENGILRNVFSTQSLIADETDFFVSISKKTVLGELDVVILNTSSDIDKPIWVLPNGDSADPYIIDTILGLSLNGTPWSAIGDWFNGLGSVAFTIAYIIIGLVLLFLLHPFIIPIVQFLISIIAWPFKVISGKLK